MARKWLKQFGHGEELQEVENMKKKLKEYEEKIRCLKRTVSQLKEAQINNVPSPVVHQSKHSDTSKKDASDALKKADTIGMTQSELDSQDAPSQKEQSMPEPPKKRGRKPKLRPETESASSDKDTKQRQKKLKHRQKKFMKFDQKATEDASQDEDEFHGFLDSSIKESAEILSKVHSTTTIAVVKSAVHSTKTSTSTRSMFSTLSEPTETYCVSTDDEHAG
jgi:hypothetical protein